MRVCVAFSAVSGFAKTATSLKCNSRNGLLILGNGDTFTGETLCRLGDSQRDSDGVRGRSITRTRFSSFTFCTILGRFLCTEAEGILKAAINGAEDVESARGGAEVGSDGDGTSANFSDEGIRAGDDDNADADKNTFSDTL